ncbi:MAG: FHA domain-containing protein [Kofleriaceae bacterium]
MVWSGGAPCLLSFRIPVGGLTIGRELLASLAPSLHDDRISRRHAHVTAHEPNFLIADLASRNGTYVAGQALVDREIQVSPPCVVRTGRTVSVLVPDVGMFEGREVDRSGGVVRGPSSRHAGERAHAAADAGQNLVIIAEPGSGKRIVADRYVRQRRARELVIFGAELGASAQVPQGAVTILLEDPQLLTPAGQATLAGWLDARPDLAVVTMCWGELDRLHGFDPQLARRLSQVEVRLAPLRERPEELAYLVAVALDGQPDPIGAHASLVEACLLRPWPGNERELISAVQRAARRAVEGGKTLLRGEDLGADAGYPPQVPGSPTVNPLQATVLAADDGRRRRTTTKPETDA